MKIVVLDGYTLNPGDLSWSGLEAMGEVTVYDRTPAEEIVNRSQGAAVLLTNKTPLTEETMEQLPHLRYIGVLATGYNVVHVEAARRRGITVTHVPSYGTQSVAQFVFALLLELVQQVGKHAEAVQRGQWSSCPDFCFTLQPMVELAGKTMGIVGYGRIGRQTAMIARAFGMNVLAAGADRSTLPTDEDVELVELLQRADVVSLHCPLTPETTQLLNKDRLALMKPSAYLINTSRGPLISEEALADALQEGRLAGAALDVLSIEPADPANPLLREPRCIVTPHIAWATVGARSRLMEVAVENIRCYLDGQPVNVVNR
ncbi:D-2-hydroxyacid dehydrogenase [Gorillibacterium sp. sgz5001074]|uniref:D-2-hydroxyacid dehydrogenase n=1 Tax=Gorillibacterium sp. sgz5001074 TaxID=3446695 RepID=UPI003F679EE6